MSSNQSEARELKEEIARLEESQKQRIKSMSTVRELNQIVQDHGPDFLKEHEEAFKDLEPEQIESELRAWAKAEFTRRRLEALSEEVAGAVATDWRTNVSGVLQTVVGVGLYTVGLNLIPRLLSKSSGRSDVNPFSDTTAATPRPSRRREGNVVHL